ncbi:MAG: AI-2E family transporter [Myxococcota bacterium]
MQQDQYHRVATWLLASAALGLMLLLVWALRAVFIPVFFAFLIAYALDPVVDWFESKSIPRGLGIAAVLSVTLLLFGGFLVLAVPSMLHELKEFTADLPEELDLIALRIDPLLNQFGLQLPHSFAEVRDLIDARDIAVDDLGSLSSLLQWLAGGAVSVLSILMSLLLIPILAFYILYDFDRMTASAFELLPHSSRRGVRAMVREVDEVMSNYIRGQMTVVIFLAIAYSLTYALLDVRLALLIGTVAGLLSFIPYVGGAAGIGLAVLMCVLEWKGWHQLASVCVAHVLIQLLEGFWITPKVVGNRLGLASIWVLLSLMAGGELFGFLGVLLGIPTAAVLKVFLRHGVVAYRRSSFYLETSSVTKDVDVLPVEEGAP